MEVGGGSPEKKCPKKGGSYKENCEGEGGSCKIIDFAYEYMNIFFLWNCLKVRLYK